MAFSSDLLAVSLKATARLRKVLFSSSHVTFIGLFDQRAAQIPTLESFIRII